MANGRETWVQPKLEPEGRDRGQGGAGQETGSGRVWSALLGPLPGLAEPPETGELPEL